jgi:hypothetical protein
MAMDCNGRPVHDSFSFIVALSGAAWAARLPKLLPGHTDGMRSGADRLANGTGSSGADAIMARSGRHGLMSKVSRWLSRRRECRLSKIGDPL